MKSHGWLAIAFRIYYLIGIYLLSDKCMNLTLFSFDCERKGIAGIFIDFQNKAEIDKALVYDALSCC